MPTTALIGVRISWRIHTSTPPGDAVSLAARRPAGRGERGRSALEPSDRFAQLRDHAQEQTTATARPRTIQLTPGSCRGGRSAGRSVGPRHAEVRDARPQRPTERPAPAVAQIEAGLRLEEVAEAHTLGGRHRFRLRRAEAWRHRAPARSRSW